MNSYNTFYLVCFCHVVILVLRERNQALHIDNPNTFNPTKTQNNDDINDNDDLMTMTISMTKTMTITISISTAILKSNRKIMMMTVLLRMIPITRLITIAMTMMMTMTISMTMVQSVTPINVPLKTANDQQFLISRSFPLLFLHITDQTYINQETFFKAISSTHLQQPDVLSKSWVPYLRRMIDSFADSTMGSDQPEVFLKKTVY